jgi:predicted ATPase with chaperone activity
VWYPPKAFKLDKTRLRRESLRELLLKAIHTHGTIRGLELARLLQVPFSLLEEVLVGLKQQQLCTVVGGAGIGGYEGMDFSLTRDGQRRAAEVLAARPYLGPAPVDLAEYTESVREQKLGRLAVTREELRERILSDMVVGEATIDQLGPALNAKGPLLLYGAPGSGKTFLAEHLAAFLRQGVFIPYAIEVDGQIIKLYDDKTHQPVQPGDEQVHAPYEAVRSKVDSRWVYVYRPFVIAGGELSLEMLDLGYQELFRTHEAPFQLKANCGILLVDDLGRQLVAPRDFLNRWIYPLETRVDHLTLVTGRKIQVPFEQLLVFSTNLSPRELADEAFWRRIRYKVHLPDPDLEQFRRIFEAQCRRAGLAFSEQAFASMVTRHYKDHARAFRACHGRDLVQQMLDYAAYLGRAPRMTDELVDRACATYFVEA